MGVIIDGKKISEELRKEIKAEIQNLIHTRGITPGLGVVLVGENPASKIYVKNKRKACEDCSIYSVQHDLPEDTSEKEVLDLIHDLNNDTRIDGILVQLPLPKQISEEKVIASINPEKDVDGFHPFNIGRLVIGNPIFQSCTPLGIIKLIESTNIEIKGKDAVIVGRSNIVGKPVAIMLLQRHATITICHTRTQNLPEKIGRADILVVAAGRAKAIKGEWIKEGAVVIDVGINRLENGSLVGDVDFESAIKRASAITPVPGGVGPMTITMLLKNTLESAKRRVKISN